MGSIARKVSAILRPRSRMKGNRCPRDSGVARNKLCHGFVSRSFSPILLSTTSPLILSSLSNSDGPVGTRTRSGGSAEKLSAAGKTNFSKKLTIRNERPTARIYIRVGRERNGSRLRRPVNRTLCRTRSQGFLLSKCPIDRPIYRPEETTPRSRSRGVGPNYVHPREQRILQLSLTEHPARFIIQLKF